MKPYQQIFEVTDQHIKGFFEDYRFLSNFHLCDINYDGIVYPSTETAYQAAKYDDEKLKKTFAQISPADSKKLCRAMPLPPEKIAEFDKKKISIMHTINQIKYRNTKLRDALLETGDRQLEESNYWGDRFWGTCDGVGENNLGKILMNLRWEIRVFGIT